MYDRQGREDRSERSHGHGHHSVRGAERMGIGSAGWGGRGRRRMRRGDIRRTILAVLVDGPANGYEVMQRLEAKSGGIWRPSPGSVYPTLQLLEDEGLARSVATDTSRTYELTDAGKAEAANAASLPDAPWETGGEGEAQVRSLRDVTVQLMMASKQVAHAGEESQVARAIEIVQRTRKELYGLLAES
jgi:DNA-binding PadR family transcriptional regulator